MARKAAKGKAKKAAAGNKPRRGAPPSSGGGWGAKLLVATVVFGATGWLLWNIPEGRLTWKKVVEPERRVTARREVPTDVAVVEPSGPEAVRSGVAPPPAPVLQPREDAPEVVGLVAPHLPVRVLPAPAQADAYRAEEKEALSALIQKKARKGRPAPKR